MNPEHDKAYDNPLMCVLTGICVLTMIPIVFLLSPIWYPLFLIGRWWLRIPRNSRTTKIPPPPPPPKKG